jgi:hypothetical protein
VKKEVWTKAKDSPLSMKMGTPKYVSKTQLQLFVGGRVKLKDVGIGTALGKGLISMLKSSTFILTACGWVLSMKRIVDVLVRCGF